VLTGRGLGHPGQLSKLARLSLALHYERQHPAPAGVSNRLKRNLHGSLVF
jgi:hypothetical protein